MTPFASGMMKLFLRSFMTPDFSGTWESICHQAESRDQHSVDLLCFNTDVPLMVHVNDTNPATGINHGQVGDGRLSVCLSVVSPQLEPALCCMCYASLAGHW